MYFPAGIPLILLVALIAWNTREEAKRSRAASKADERQQAQPTPAEPKAHADESSADASDEKDA